MTRGNRPRGRADTNRPRTTSAKETYRASADRLGDALGMLPRREQTRAYLGHANAIDFLADVVEERVSRTRTPRLTSQKPSSGR